MAYVDLLSRSLPGYVSPAKFTIARWTALIGIFVPRPAFGGRGYTNPNGLRSVWSRRKSQMYDLILENRSLAPAPNAPAAPAVGLSLGQTVTTNVPTAHAQMVQVVAAWAQAVADALDDDGEEEDDNDGEDDNEEEDAYDEAGDDEEDYYMDTGAY